MSVARMQVMFDRSTGIPEDTQTNTWFFDGDSATYTTGATVAEAAMPLLTAFYQAIDGFMSDDMFLSPARVQAYDMGEPEPRIPVFQSSIPLTLAASGFFPAEVSMCLSFQGERVSGVNQARRRGRLYLPTFTGAHLTITGGRPHWLGTTVNAVIAAAEGVRNNSIAGLNWAVFSPTTYAETGSLDTATNDVTDGWVDDEPDTQRRRGGAGGSRVVFPAA